MTGETRLREWLAAYLGRLLGIAPATVAFDRTLADYGLDSVDAIMMAGELEDSFGLEMDPASFLRYANFEELIVGLGPVIDEAGAAAAPPAE